MKSTLHKANAEKKGTYLLRAEEEAVPSEDEDVLTAEQGDVVLWPNEGLL